MNRILIGALLLAMMMLLAGCAGEGSSPTVNQTTTNTTELESIDYPAGFNENGITDSKIALTNHNESLKSTGVIVNFSYKGPEEDTATNITYKSSVQSSSVLISCSSNCLRNTSNSSYRLYIGNGRSYHQLWTNGRIVNQQNTDSDSTHATLHRNTGAVELAHHLPSQNASAVDVFNRNNTTHYRYVYNNSTLIVQENGLIKSLEADGDLVHVRVYIRPAPGLEVPPPRWTHQIEPDSYEGGYGGDYGDDTASSGCGSNDGDQSYDEDNDRDNDGLCDEG